MSEQAAGSHPLCEQQGTAAEPLTDAQLLARFVAGRDQAAFEALVRAHGPLVFGVCRRILGKHHESEDAFQATFLALATHAGKIGRPEMLANWLYRVARHAALKSKAVAARQKQRESQMSRLPEADPADDAMWNELEPVLDVELGQLSEILRAPVLLCDLEGKTRQEAARQLGWPEATVSSRLIKARSLLARRLARRGFALSAGALAVLVSQNAASAAVPAALVSSTVSAAAGAAATASAVAAGSSATKGSWLAASVWKSTLLVKGSLIAIVGGAGLAAAVALQPDPQAPTVNPPAAVSELPAEVWQALDDNARQLSPISLSFTQQMKSTLPLEEAAERLNMGTLPPSEMRIFNKTPMRVVWQAPKIYHATRSPIDKADKPESVLEYEDSFDGAVHFQIFYHFDQAGVSRGANLNKQPIADWIGEQSIRDDWLKNLYLGRAAGMVLRWQRGAQTTPRVESELRAALGTGARIISVEQVPLTEREHLRIVLETVNPIKQFADKYDLEAVHNGQGGFGSMKPEQRQRLIDQITAQRGLPALQRMVFYLDPALHYAVRCSEERNPPTAEGDPEGTLLSRSDRSDFVQVGDRPLWLPKRCETEFHTFNTTPGKIFAEAFITEVLELGDLDTKAVPDEQFALTAAPGVLVLDWSHPAAKQTKQGYVTYKAPENAAELTAVIEKAIQTARAPAQSAPVAAAPLEMPKKTSRWWPMFLLANGVLVAGVLAFLLLRRNNGPS